MFSTATFHWVPDHPALFSNIFTALRPGGRLHAQCGGGPNLAAAHALAEEVMALRSRSRHSSAAGRASGSSPPTARRTTRLVEAGFVDVESPASRRRRPRFATETDYREFVTTVIYHPHLARLPERPAAAVH